MKLASRPRLFQEIQKTVDRYSNSHRKQPVLGKSEVIPTDALLPVNVAEAEKTYIITSSLPGYQKDEIDVELYGNVVCIRARWVVSDDPSERYHRRERDLRTKSRRIVLPAADPSGHVTANLESGVLTVLVPKEQRRAVRVIKVK